MPGDTALIVCEDGYILPGRAWGASGRALGELVFSTGMTGYQETLTDPSYRRQIVIQTAPHIGNTGVNNEDPESRQIWVAGYIVRDPAPRASNWRTSGELDDLLVDQGIVGMRDVDTRALTRHVREAGAMRAGIFSGDALPEGASVWPLPEHVAEVLVSIVKTSPEMAGSALVNEVTTPDAYTIEPAGEWEGKPARADVVAVDLGIKARSPQHLAERGARVHVVPSSVSLDEILAMNPDGVFFSNGPGDPETAHHEVELARGILTRKIPFFGICLGNQILGRALGFGTYKLTYGHRGVNQPVKDIHTGRVEITAHNHGFAVDAPIGEVCHAPYPDADFGRVEVSHVGLNDNVVEGLHCLDLPAFSVQFHPEAAAGPHDGEHLFDRFVALMEEYRAQTN
ncbi:MAG: glutamine-hydrolyzing carbamoyl-phosphate synthase small subunit [Actinomycetaceae bacterium]|nr:glutamine-hydrolyzing carbamoyl-phosphate synthase small subunit [Actinomycetaceae bacterium]MDU0969487.1 glutamine-hydrolyzing carbamoyl-phosphate synthase small subunit [Actinomycetaceae bacterium]